jgi:hypothetical protein
MARNIEVKYTDLVIGKIYKIEYITGQTARGTFKGYKNLPFLFFPEHRGYDILHFDIKDNSLIHNSLVIGTLVRPGERGPYISTVEVTSTNDMMHELRYINGTRVKAGKIENVRDHVLLNNVVGPSYLLPVSIKAVYDVSLGRRRSNTGIYDSALHKPYIPPVATGAGAGARARTGMSLRDAFNAFPYGDNGDNNTVAPNTGLCFRRPGRTGCVGRGSKTRRGASKKRRATRRRS